MVYSCFSPTVLAQAITTSMVKAPMAMIPTAPYTREHIPSEASIPEPREAAARQVRSGRSWCNESAGFQLLLPDAAPLCHRHLHGNTRERLHSLDSIQLDKIARSKPHSTLRRKLVLETSYS